MQMEAEKNICQEFKFLISKSNVMFERLRELSPFGNKWVDYFQKTFQTFTKLWTFQQQYRIILENNLNLKRYEIGKKAK